MTAPRTRFAPSPTGFLHIGGVRSALFNWLLARRHGGQYILRVDDTDEQRNVDAALAPILHGFEWLGLKWDEGPVFQSKRKDRYREAVDKLIASGHAYYDYALPAEMDAERKAAEQEKKQFQYSRRWMADNADDRARYEKEGRKWVVRLKMPRAGTLQLHDLVRGDVEFTWQQEADHVIQRGDGSFIYHLANVVDDFDLKITHVVRAEEHLSNTPRQVFMIDALGYPRPIYGHLPYVAEPGSKRKLSKRKLDQYLKNPEFGKVHQHGMAIAQAMGLGTTVETFNPVIVDFYEQVGYIPDAVVNYLVLLGWSLDDKTEFLTRQQMIDNFALERVNPGPASFDPAKLMAFQLHYMQQVPIAEKVERVKPFVERAGWPFDAARVTRIVEALGDRLKVFGDILLQGKFFFVEEPEFDEKAFEKRVKASGAVEKLTEYRGWLADRGDFSVAALEADTKAWVESKGLGLGDIVHSVRVAVTGTAAGPGLFESMSIVGKDGCLKRIDRTLAKARG
jgi:glutamyl/glutaminyl-tRNA synthetase